MFSLVQRCSRRGLTLLMTHETGAFFGFEEGSVSNISHLSDNVFLLRYLLDGTVDRSFIVLKTRATMHEQQPRAFTIGSSGMDLSVR